MPGTACARTRSYEHRGAQNGHGDPKRTLNSRFAAQHNPKAPSVPPLLNKIDYYGDRCPAHRRSGDVGLDSLTE